MKRVLFDVAALIARVATGVIFVAHGWQKWQSGLGATAQGFREMGIPMPELAAGYATIVETVGGIFLILGLLVRPVALLLLINMLGAIAFVHGTKGVMVGEGGWELTGALGALSLLFLALGGGRISLDAIFGAMFRRRADRRAAEEELTAYGPGRTPTAGGVAGTTTTAGGTAGPAATGGPTTPASGSGETPEVPRQPAAPASGRLNDDDMREIDALVSDEPPQHRRPPNE
ncbi:putative oxidoreductase [Nonomuraea thailandensis]|uniref:Oxidoreductase n=1 Tax=Nonomuraea thailandensis TaxID=1188745 RepID=A0A9X2GTD5_9ACTN|nr:DoxX family protein [Nonomuraea thailandensis]MCP2363522.1 putative oxidoreductase [Nonomuraea thailandensis]